MTSKARSSQTYSRAPFSPLQKCFGRKSFRGLGPDRAGKFGPNPGRQFTCVLHGFVLADSQNCHALRIPDGVSRCPGALAVLAVSIGRTRIGVASVHGILMPRLLSRQLRRVQKNVFLVTFATSFANPLVAPIELPPMMPMITLPSTLRSSSTSPDVLSTNFTAATIFVAPAPKPTR